MSVSAEAEVEFLNVDLLLVGRFDRQPLLSAARREVFVLHEGPVFDNKEGLIFEVAAPELDLSRTLERLLRWVAGLPAPARRSWAAASRRVFDIGIQAGLGPHEMHWTIHQEQVAALAKLGAEVVLTVYGAGRARRPRRSPSRAARR